MAPFSTEKSLPNADIPKVDGYSVGAGETFTFTR